MWHWCWGRCRLLTHWPPRRFRGHPISAIFGHVSKTNRRGKWIIGESRGHSLEAHPHLPPLPWAKIRTGWPLKEKFEKCHLLGGEIMAIWNKQYEPSSKSNPLVLIKKKVVWRSMSVTVMVLRDVWPCVECITAFKNVPKLMVDREPRY